MIACSFWAPLLVTVIPAIISKVTLPFAGNASKVAALKLVRVTRATQTLKRRLVRFVMAIIIPITNILIQNTPENKNKT